jgi:hypothetical protein
MMILTIYSRIRKGEGDPLEKGTKIVGHEKVHSRK